MDAALIIADWKRRLTVLTENPAYVFRDTPQRLIDEHHRRMSTFAGYSEAEVAKAEATLGVQFPMVFRTYLREMAKSPGDLFRGSDLPRIDQFEEFRTNAIELLAETDSTLKLPPEAVVFLSHQGYTFVYIMASGGLDSPAMQWTETEREPEQVAATFAELVEAELELMEHNNKTSRESGGYYVTLHPDGTTTESYPACASDRGKID